MLLCKTRENIAVLIVIRPLKTKKKLMLALVLMNNFQWRNPSCAHQNIFGRFVLFFIAITDLTSGFFIIISLKRKERKEGGREKERKKERKRERKKEREKHRSTLARHSIWELERRIGRGGDCDVSPDGFQMYATQRGTKSSIKDWIRNFGWQKFASTVWILHGETNGKTELHFKLPGISKYSKES